MGTREDCLNKASEYVTADRASTYGKPEDNFGNIAKIWNAQGVRIDGRKVQAHDVALMMAGMKLARLRHNPAHEDSWIDIAGYAACGMEIATNDVDDDHCCDDHRDDVAEFNGRKLGPGQLFIAPLGSVDTSKWTQLGFTVEGAQESSAFVVPQGMLDADSVDLGDAIQSEIYKAAGEAMDRYLGISKCEHVSEPAKDRQGWISDMYRCAPDEEQLRDDDVPVGTIGNKPHAAHRFGRSGGMWCDGFV